MNLFPSPPSGWPQQITQFLQNYFTQKDATLEERFAALEKRVKQLESK